MSQCTCTTDKEMTCIVHPTTRSLKERIQQLEYAQRWIPVSERLPDDGQIVLCRYAGVYENRVCGFWRDLGNVPHFGYPGEADGKGSQPATEWMPLPPPPEETDNE